MPRSLRHSIHASDIVELTRKERYTPAACYDPLSSRILPLLVESWSSRLTPFFLRALQKGARAAFSDGWSRVLINVCEERGLFVSGIEVTLDSINLSTLQSFCGVEI